MSRSAFSGSLVAITSGDHADRVARAMPGPAAIRPGRGKLAGRTVVLADSAVPSTRSCAAHLDALAQLAVSLPSSVRRLADVHIALTGSSTHVLRCRLDHHLISRLKTASVPLEIAALLDAGSADGDDTSGSTALWEAKLVSDGGVVDRVFFSETEPATLLAAAADALGPSTAIVAVAVHSAASQTGLTLPVDVIARLSRWQVRATIDLRNVRACTRL